ncbi:hypothetical protein SISNIDRAFT_355077 [Sistotremastrum niveocremeum HHB9708]|uniref:Extracellular membrane protein CFEM domain-containing protein n=2 Tax=Sistotremastraceae TaxID=3402574 RepID=A0A164MEG6_9AGAM|nr:hypothetical protein SISNIDRAFT_355077 [Sistotremastrum niveocremeum HHB9708]KZT34616.1 hypothetical protein SISSUDRAFT_1036170 [Sistotremastrum suecicum HHB10207 ss-3]
MQLVFVLAAFFASALATPAGTSHARLALLHRQLSPHTPAQCDKPCTASGGSGDCPVNAGSDCTCSAQYIGDTKACFQCLITAEAFSSTSDAFSQFVTTLDGLIQVCQISGFQVPSETLTAADGATGSTVPSSTGGIIASATGAGPASTSTTPAPSSSTKAGSSSTIPSTANPSSSAAPTTTAKSNASILKASSIYASLAAFVALAVF